MDAYLWLWGNPCATVFTDMEPLTRFRFKWFCEHVRLVGKRMPENDSVVLVFAGYQWVAGGLAFEIAAEMDGGLQGSKSPLAPLKGGDQHVPWPALVFSLPVDTIFFVILQAYIIGL